MISSHLAPSIMKGVSRHLHCKPTPWVSQISLFLLTFSSPFLPQATSLHVCEGGNSAARHSPQAGNAFICQMPTEVQESCRANAKGTVFIIYHFNVLGEEKAVFAKLPTLKNKQIFQLENCLAGPSNNCVHFIPKLLLC